MTGEAFNQESTSPSQNVNNVSRFAPLHFSINATGTLREKVSQISKLKTIFYENSNSLFHPSLPTSTAGRTLV